MLKMHHEGRVADSNYAEVSPRKRDVAADEVEKILGVSGSLWGVGSSLAGKTCNRTQSALLGCSWFFSSSYLAATVSQPQKYVHLKSLKATYNKKYSNMKRDIKLPVSFQIRKYTFLKKNKLETHTSNWKSWGCIVPAISKNSIWIHLWFIQLSQTLREKNSNCFSMYLKVRTVIRFYIVHYYL